MTPEELRSQLQKSIKSVDEANAAWQVVENFVVAALAQADADKTQAIVDVESAKEAALKSAANDLAAIQAKHDALLASAKSALTNPDDESAKSAALAMIQDAETPEIEKKKSALKEEIAKAQDELAKLEA